ncbi:alpha/beta fold hydrolase [Roseivivax isoporae]|uniref:alpha/beta fold hydrolase n=1 Tax=Roseivivax isoporae TaxID=591206 RepID=UPI0004B84076|nr:alpha/beta fold hydrolase [Roseivivax isoporae]
MLFLHCALAHSGAWKGVAERLSDRIDAVAPDMPGHGRSADWDGTGDLHDVVTGIAGSFLDDGSLGTPVHLVGHSFGGTVALRLAEAHPDRVASLTLVEPVLFAAARGHAPEAFAGHVAEFGPIRAAFDAGRREEAARIFTTLWGDPARGWDDLSAAQRAALGAGMAYVLATDGALMEDSRGLLAPGRPEAVTAPTLLIRGAETRPVVAGIHAGLEARLPNAREVVVPQAGHMVPITHPDAVAGALSGQIPG